MLVVDCATNSTLQELKTNKSSGVFTYEESDDFHSVSSNRHIVWRTCDDILELSEHSLNKNLIDFVLKIQFKNTLILPNGVSIHETPDRIYVLVTTLVSAHRFAFDHPNKLFTNPTGISSAISYMNNATAQSSTTSLLYSIFHNVPVEFLNSSGNSCQLPNSTSSNTMLGPASPFPFLASCSWINANLEAYFVVSKNSGSLHVVKLPSPGELKSEPSVHTIDLKQSSFIGMTMNLLTGFVPSFKSTSNGAEAAISLLSYSTDDDDLIFALCRDFHIRVLSLKKQEIIITHNLLQNQQQLQSQLHSATGKDGFVSAGTTTGHQHRQPVSIKLWWPDDDTNSPFPNLVVYLSGSKQKSFYFFETVIRQGNSTSHVQSQSASMNSSYSATHTVASQTSQHLKFLYEVVAPLEQDFIDYFVSDNQIWALMQHNDIFSLQYYSIDSPNASPNAQLYHPPLGWMPVISDVNASPEMEVRSELCNSREYYLKEIFWRGHFSLSTIAKAISVSNRISIDDDKFNTVNLKIDHLVKEAINLVDGIIRTQIGDNQLEFTVEEYTKLESDAWQRLYSFCLGYHSEENKPLSIFVDIKTGAKGLVRQGKIDFIPALDSFDELIDHYFLLCKESPGQMDLFNGPALDYLLNALLSRLGDRINGVFASTLHQSIRELLSGMSLMSKSLTEEDLLNFAALMKRISTCSAKNSKTLTDIAKMIAEDSLLPEMNLTDNPGMDIDDFFIRCPMAVEAINFLLAHINFAFTPNASDFLDNNNVSAYALDGVDENDRKFKEALQYEIDSRFSNLLSSQCGLNFVVTNVAKIVNMRYKFCRDLFLFQYFLNKFRLNLRADHKTKITAIETDTIPTTTQQLFALEYLSWASRTPMVNPNIWWVFSDDQSGDGMTSIVNASSITPPKNVLKGGSNASSLENSELLSVLEMREYINLNRIGTLSHESTFYEAYPHSTILHFFIQFTGGILVKRLLSYKFVIEYGNDLSTAFSNIWSKIISNYLVSVGQLLWPHSAGQLKLAEFLLGVAQYDLLERYNQRLHWCLEHAYSRFFFKGICSLVTGDGQKAIRHFEQALNGVNYDAFLYKIFAKKARHVEMSVHDGGDVPSGSVRGSSGIEVTVPPNSRTIFRYYNKLIQLFKRYSSPDFVIELVEVALNTLDPKLDPDYEEHHSALRSTLFACHLELDNVVQAYDAMISILDSDQRRICLRQFILNLCETGDLASLVSFSYQGLEDEFVSILEWKARTSSARFYSGKHFHALDNFSTTSRLSASTAGSEACSNSAINYYQILYTYFIRVNNYRRAAQSMYDYYRQLNKEANTYAASDSVELLQKQADSLLTARNCLKLVDANYAWIIKNALKRTDGVASEGTESKQQLKRKHGNTVNYSHQEKTVIDIVDDEELLCEYEMVNARLRLLQRNPKEYAIASTILSPEETVILCIGASLYNNAFRISTLCNLKLEPIFDGMASKYIQLLNGAFNRRRIDDDMLAALLSNEMGGLDPFSQFANDPLGSPSQMQSFNIDLLDIFLENGSNTGKCSFIGYSSLSICDRMWHLILHYLERYEDNPQVSSHLMKTVAEKLLSNGITLPTSLLKVYQKVNCSEVIRLLMTYNFLPEATQVSLDYMNAFMGNGTEYFDIKHHLYANCPPLCVPLHIFDCLLKILREENEESKLDQWQNRLATEETSEPLRSVIASVDDYANEETVDYEALYRKLSKRRQKLEDVIGLCSN